MKTFSEQLLALEAKAVASLSKAIMKHNKKLGKDVYSKIELPEHLQYNLQHNNRRYVRWIGFDSENELCFFNGLEYQQHNKNCIEFGQFVGIVDYYLSL